MCVLASIQRLSLKYLCTTRFRSIEPASRSRSFILTSSSTSPEYNHGLTGYGKGKPSKRKKVKKEDELPLIDGEIIFGLHSVSLALEAARRPRLKQVFVNTKFQQEENQNEIVRRILEVATDSGIPIQAAHKETLDMLAGNRPHQGVCLDAGHLRVPLWEADPGVCLVNDSDTSLPVWLYLHNIQDPMNFGAILRTAFYLNISRVVIPPSNSCKLSPVVSKASAGALEVIDLLRLHRESDLEKLFEWWKDRGGEVVGTGIIQDNNNNNNTYCNLEEFNTEKPTMVVLGNEGSGLESDLSAMCDRVLTIPSRSPTFGSHLDVDSLNVSVAAGILLHWIQRSCSRKR